LNIIASTAVTASGSVPEPGTFGACAIGLVVLAGWQRREVRQLIKYSSA
jgi:hypothetical protein